MGLFDGTPLERPIVCDRCGRLEAECECPAESTSRSPPEKQTARLSVEKRRKGKLVTVVRGLEGDHLNELLSRLKSTCGAGGTLKHGEIEIQGRQLEPVRQALENLGYRTQV